MKSLVASIFLVVSCPLSAQRVAYSFDEARDLMIRHSAALKVADAELQVSRRERQRVNALWWPQLQAEGMYLHLSEDIEVREPLSQFTNPAKDYVQEIIPGEELLTGLLDRIGEYTFTLPLITQDVASVGLTAEWVAFSGGKRLLADRVARRVVDVAQLGRARLLASQEVVLVERYYGLALAQHATEVCRQRYEGMLRHYDDALRMEQLGLIDKAARLFAQVAMEEAKREWSHALSVEQVRQSALRQLLGITDNEVQVMPSSPLFAVRELPSESHYIEAMRSGNYMLSTLTLEEQMASDKLRMDLGDYLPDVALFGKQTLYAHGLPSNLFPRTVVGVGFTWNLFDGLERERRVSQTRLTQQLLVEGMVTMSELIDAENALAASRLARLSARYACDVAWANLQMVCGGNFKGTV